MYLMANKKDVADTISLKWLHHYLLKAFLVVTPR